MPTSNVTADVAFAQSQLAYITVMALSQVVLDRGDPRLATLIDALQAGFAGARSTMVGPDIAKEATRLFDNESARLLEILRKRANG